MSQTRRLAAILAADVVGYSRLMGADEGGTLQRLKEIRAELIDPMIAAHNSKAFAVAQGWYAVSLERGRGRWRRNGSVSPRSWAGPKPEITIGPSATISLTRFATADVRFELDRGRLFSAQNCDRLR
jgi:hypothetical protein